MIDREAERAVTGWLRLGDRVTGRKPLDGCCEARGRTGYLSLIGTARLCALLSRRDSAELLTKESRDRAQEHVTLETIAVEAVADPHFEVKMRPSLRIA
jgi:hypothetical protein